MKIGNGTLPETTEYIHDRGLDDEKMLEGVCDFEFGKEFLVLVINVITVPKKLPAHLTS